VSFLPVSNSSSGQVLINVIWNNLQRHPFRIEPIAVGVKTRPVTYQGCKGVRTVLEVEKPVELEEVEYKRFPSLWSLLGLCKEE